MIKISVCFALLLQDDFDGAVVFNGGHRFEINGRPCRPVSKPDGYYVFTSAPCEPCTLRVGSTHYVEETVAIDPKSLEAAGRVVTLRLMRTFGARFSDCERLEGVCAPHRLMMAVARASPPLLLHRMEERQEGWTVALQGYTPLSLCQQRFCIGEGRTRELFVMTRKLSDGSYLTDRPPRHSHRSGEPLRRVSGARCDEKGRYAIPIEPQARDRVDSVEYYDEEAGKWVCL